MNLYIAIPVTLGGGGLLTLGLVIVRWILNNWTESGRERKKRKTDFLSYIWGWETSVNDWLGRYHEAANDLVKRKADFMARAEIMKTNYGWIRRPKFETLVNAIRSMTGGEISNTAQNEKGELTGVRKLLDNLSALILFVEKN
jgi:hypothetical protein